MMGSFARLLAEKKVLTREDLYWADVEGDIENGSLMSGQIAGLINKEQTCKEIIEELFKDAKELFIKFGDKNVC